MKMQKNWLVVGLIVVGLALSGAACETSGSKASNATDSTTTRTYDVTYAGRNGVNALELLKEKHETQSTKEGFVTSIDGRAAGEREFWAFYVNDQQATVGAKDYLTKDADQIGWRIEKY